MALPRTLSCPLLRRAIAIPLIVLTVNSQWRTSYSMTSALHNYSRQVMDL
jgi:hypothetical protein